MQLIAWKDGINSSLLVEPGEIDCLEKVSRLNEDATSVHDLYPDGTTTCGSRSIWEDMIASPSRAATQRELREAISSAEEEAANAEPKTVQRQLLEAIRCAEEEGGTNGGEPEAPAVAAS
jgi:hypothetical protein